MNRAMNGFKATERRFQFVLAWWQIAKLEPTRGIRLAVTNDGAANVQGHVHKRAPRLIE